MNHGTLTSYRAGCHCAACRAACATYERAYRAGLRTRVDASEVREHIKLMVGAGQPLRAIARAAGCSTLTISEVLRGERATVLPRTEDAVLSVPIMTMASGGLVPPAPTRRLIAEMLGAGIPQRDLETMMGRPLHAMRRWPSVRETTWRRVVTTYKLLARQGIVPASVLEEVS